MPCVQYQTSNNNNNNNNTQLIIEKDAFEHGKHHKPEKIENILIPLKWIYYC